MRFKKIVFVITYFVSSIVYAKVSSISYEVKLIADNKLEIRMSFVDSEPGTVVYLPKEYGGNKELYKDINIIKISQTAKLHTEDNEVNYQEYMKLATIAHSQDVMRQKFESVDDTEVRDNSLQLTKQVPLEILNTNLAHAKYIKHKPNELVTIVYQIIPGINRLPANMFEARGSIVTNNYLHFIGATVLAYPKVSRKDILDISMKLNVPDHYMVSTSFGHQKKYFTLKTKLEKIINAIFVAGEYNSLSGHAKGNPFYIAYKGQWNFTDSALKMRIAQILKAERNFFNDHNFPYYLVSIIPVGKSSNVISGMALTNAFALFIPEDQVLDQRLLKLFVHELFHTWNTPIIFSKKLNNQAEYFWFTEGITDYYTDLISFREKLINLKQYIGNYNRVVFNYMTSPVKNYTNKQVGEKFWSNYDIGKLPYQRGYLLAHRWNQKIKQADPKKNWSLDDLIRDVVAKYQRDNDEIDMQELNNLSKKYIPEGILIDIEKYIFQGHTVPIAEQYLGYCTVYQPSLEYLVDPGFDLESSLAHGYVKDVVANSNAEQAGLKNGQQLITASYSPKELHKQIVVTIKRVDGSESTIRYFGHGSHLVEVPNFKLDIRKVNQDPGRCLEWFN